MSGWFVLGEVLCLQGSVGRMAAAALLAVCLLCAWTGKGLCYWLLPVFFVLGMGRAWSEQAVCAREQALGLEGQPAVIFGTLRAVEEKENSWMLELEGCRAAAEDGAGMPDAAGEPGRLRRLVVYVGQEYTPQVKALRLGNVLRVQGEPERMEPARNPGQFDYGAYYRSQKVLYRMFADQMTVERTSVRRGQEFLRQLSDELKGVLDKIAKPKDAGIYRAVLFGDKAFLDEGIRQLYQSQGIAHLLAISGLHLSLFSAVIYGSLRRLGLGYGKAGLAGSAVLLGYSLMAGASPSVIRAWIMMSCAFGAACLGRTYDLLSALGLAAVCLLWDSPYLCGQAGFLLSFGALLGIGAAAPCLGSWLEGGSGQTALPGDAEENGGKRPDHGPTDSNAAQWRQRLVSAVAAGLGVQLVTTPVILYYFYQIPVWGLFLNLMVVPLMGIVVISGGAGVLAGCFSLRAGAFALGSGSWMLAIYEDLCRGFARLPASTLVTGRPRWWQLAVYYGLLTGALVFLKNGACRGGKVAGSLAGMERSLPGRMALVAVGVLLLSVVLLPLPVRGLQVTFLDVGQGDGICLRTSRHTVLVDGGSTDEKELARYRLEPFLKSQAETEVDYAIVSHGDADHINGLEGLMESGEIQIRRLILPASGREDPAYEGLLRMAEVQGGELLYMKQGDQLRLGKLILTCIYPDAAARQDRNEQSLVLRADYGAFHLLLTGDMTTSGEEAILQDSRLREQLSGIQILKVAHHGSDTSTGDAWAKALAPRWAVVSYGMGNRYGHPKAEVLKRLENIGARIFETGKQGAVTVWTDGKRVGWRTMLP